MTEVKIKDRFEVTLPPEVRERLGVAVGDVLEVTTVPEGVLLRPAVDRQALVREIDRLFDSMKPLPEDIDRTEDEIMEDVIAEIKEARAEERPRSK